MLLSDVYVDRNGLSSWVERCGLAQGCRCALLLQAGRGHIVAASRTAYYTLCVASPSRRDAGFTFRPNDGKNQSLYFINFITK